MWLDIKFNKVFWWKEVVVEVEIYFWFSFLFGVGYVVLMYKRKVSWRLDINCFVVIYLKWFLFIFRFIRFFFLGNIFKKKGNCVEYNINF